MSSIILKENLFEEVLIRPAARFDELCIVSGFATPAMGAHQLDVIKERFDRQDVRINLVVGMTPSISGISKPHHKNFVKLVNEKSIFSCSYLKSTVAPTHTKLYCWLKNGVPQEAFLASANYTLNAFKRFQDEVATDCNPIEAYDYYNSKIPHSLYCTCDEANEMVRDIISKTTSIQDSENEQIILDANIGKEGIDWVKLPLFSERDKQIHTHSGLNWGQRDGREPNQAYIPIPAKIQKSNFFPPRGQYFSVLTDDGFPFVCVVAQDNGKALHTTNNNSEFGEYFRQKLGVPLGEPVTLADLDRFGSRYVKFTKINEEEYYMEFSPSS